MDYLTDPETQQFFADTRRANARKLQLQQEQDERWREQAAEVAERLAEERRKQAAARLENNLRTAFFEANPAAVESDWNRLKDSIRDEHMRDAAAQNTATVFDQIRSEASQRRQEELDRRSRFEQLPERA